MDQLVVPKDVDLITREERDSTRLGIKRHIQQWESTCMDLGRMLWLVQAGKWFEEWGYESFEDYVDRELGFALRKARYHISVWNRFGVELAIPVEKIQAIGWFKAGLITPVVTASNVDAWIERAGKTSAVKLQEEVRRARELTSKAEQLPIETTGAKVTEAARVPGGDEWAPVSGESNGHQMDVPTQVIEMTAGARRTGDALPPEDDRIVAVMKFPLFDTQYDVVLRALDAAQAMTGSISRSHQLDTICTLFLSGVPTDDFSKESTLAWLLQRIEQDFGVQLSVLRPGEIAGIVQPFADFTDGNE